MSQCFGGPTSTEKGLQGQSENLSETLSANAATEFGEQQGTIKDINAQLSRLESGQTGPGFGAQEEAANVAGIENNAGAMARNVTQAVQNQNAGQTFQGSGDTSGLGRTSAIRQQIGEEAKSSAAGQEANALNANTAANFATGRAETVQTIGGLDALSGQENPNAAYSEATNANSTSFGEAKTIQEQQQEKDAAIAGLVTGGLGLGADFLTGGIAGAAGGGGIGGFFKGGLKGLSGQSGSYSGSYSDVGG
jgi:hypothetical protein